jgi:ParB family chromosome partitioning protein
MPRPRLYTSVAEKQRVYRQRKSNAREEVEALRNSSDEWFTPGPIIDLARQVLGGIDFDPASCEFAQRTVQATRWFSKADDGLAQLWHGRVWLNPPYSYPLVERFTGKLLDEFDAGHITAAIVLVNNATDTAWFQRLLARFPACFTRGRIRFYRVDRKTISPRLGQVFFYLGDDVSRFAWVFDDVGIVRVATGLARTTVDRALRRSHHEADGGAA